MSHLPTLKPRQVIHALKKVGFLEYHQRGSHLYLWHSGGCAVLHITSYFEPNTNLTGRIQNIALNFFLLSF